MVEQTSTTRLVEAIEVKPRLPMALLPTPLEEAPHLSERLGVRILLKRDDLTGLALGGNKARKLEFLIADAQNAGADTIITTGGSQSNHARITAAACRRAGLTCYLILDRGLHPEPQGNLLLDQLLGANVQLIDSQDPAVMAMKMEELGVALRAKGRTPYVVPRGGSTPAGATGYAAFVPEILEQLDGAGLSVTHLYVATGSCGTHSGILAGLAAAGYPIPLQGISVSRSQAQQSEKIRQLADATLEHLGVPERVDVERILVDDRFVGPGYGHLTPETVEAIEILADDEAVFLDPVYTGKAMAGLIGHAREGRFMPSDTVVFIHTGGVPALFAYSRELAGDRFAERP